MRKGACGHELDLLTFALIACFIFAPADLDVNYEVKTCDSGYFKFPSGNNICNAEPLELKT